MHLPLREIKKRFTKTDLVILAWRSQEQAYQLKRRYDTGKTRKPKTRFLDRETVNAFGEEEEQPGGKRRQTEGVPEGLPDRFYNKDGEVDLSRVTGEDAWKYFAAQGIKLPRFPGRERARPEK